MRIMGLPLRRYRDDPGSAATQIDAADQDLTDAVAIAMERLRAGEPATEELRQIVTASRRRKRLYQRHTDAFA